MLRLYASGLFDSIIGASGRAPHPPGAQLPFSSTPACAAIEIHAANTVEALMKKTRFVVLNIIMYPSENTASRRSIYSFPSVKTAGEAYHHTPEQAYERFWKWISGDRC